MGTGKHKRRSSQDDDKDRYLKQGVEQTSEKFSPDNFPIHNPFEEKAAVDMNLSSYCTYLTEQTTGVPIEIYTEGLYERIREVYFRCFKHKGDMNVVSDFIAFYPEIAFGAPWLCELVKKHAEMRGIAVPKKGTPADRFFQMIAYGFRRTSKPGARGEKALRPYKVFLGKLIIHLYEQRFSRLYDSKDWCDADEDHREKTVSEMVQGILNEYHDLSPISRKLHGHLLHKRRRKAAVLIAHIRVGVPIRELEGKSPISPSQELLKSFAETA